MAESKTGTLIANRYRLEHQVGEGGMGSVWVAEDEKLERWVAVKLLGEGVASSRSVRERFEREAMAIAKLRSPNVVQIFDYGAGSAAGHAFIVMELLSGQDLYTWLKDNRPVPLSTISNIVTQVAKALSAAHRANIIHRDLKPANIFVVRDHEEEVVKVFDFGLAKGLTDNSLRELKDRTGEGVLLGTPRYMSPEQAHGAREVDHRTDLWSLAVIAYLAITGRLPFEGRGVGEVITKIATEEPAPPSVRVAKLPQAIDDFFEQAFAKLPEERFDNAMDLAEAFENACGSGRTSRELIAVGDGDTLVELTQADTEMNPDDAPTVEQPLPDVAPELVERDEPSRVADEVQPERTPSRPWVAYALGAALIATVSWALFKDDPAAPANRGTAPNVIVTAPPPVPQDDDPQARTVADNDADETTATPRPGRRPETPDADSSADPEGSADPVSDSALELFEDRH